MMLLKPNGKIDLQHRAFFLRNAPGQSCVVAAAEDGCYSIIRSEFREVHSVCHLTGLRAIAPHPVAPWLAKVRSGSGTLDVQTFDGDRVASLHPPELSKAAPSWVEQGFSDCLFDPTGEFLWLVAPQSVDKCRILLVETTRWSVVGKCVVNDPFGGSRATFHSTDIPGLMVLWQAAGQDGQQVYWLKREHRSFDCQKEPCLRNTTPPVFSPNKEELLVVNENNAICKRSFPDLKQVGPALELDDEDNLFAESLAYLNGRQALASTNDNRIFLLDTESMTIADEVAVEGHEPRPVGEYFPSLRQEQRLGTDITWFTRLGNTVLFVYRRDEGTGLKGWKDSLLWYVVE